MKMIGPQFDKVAAILSRGQVGVECLLYNRS